MVLSCAAAFTPREDEVVGAVVAQLAGNAGGRIAQLAGLVEVQRAPPSGPKTISLWLLTSARSRSPRAGRPRKEAAVFSSPVHALAVENSGRWRVGFGR